MRFIVVLVCVCFASCVPASAADDTPAPLTIAKCLEINGALSALEVPYDYVVKDGSKETVAHRKYRLGEAWGPIALNRTSLFPIVKAAQEASNKLVEEIAGEGKQIARFVDPDKPDKGETAQWKDYSAKLTAFTERPCGLTLARIKASDLKPSDDNPIPFSISLTLEAILDR